VEDGVDDPGYKTLYRVFGADIAEAWQDIIVRTDEIEDVFTDLECSLDKIMKGSMLGNGDTLDGR
jgi:hypothetical protein